MKLRTQLMLAFLVMSVLPLTVVTLYSYSSSAAALRRAASAEAGSMAAELGQRMEFVTADLGRRVDLLATAPSGLAARAGDREAAADLPQRLAPLLGEAAALLDRLEFIPERPHPAPAPRLVRGARARPALPSAPPSAPVPPDRVVVDLSKLVDYAAKAAADSKPDAEAIERMIRAGLELGLKGAAAGIKLGAGVLARELEKRAAERRAVVVRDLEAPVERDGQVVGKVTATINLDRVLATVLAASRKDQGEIAFAIDASQRIHTVKPADRAVVQPALASGQGGAERPEGNWVAVTRKDPSGITFGIVRPVGDSLGEIRQAAVRNLMLGLSIIGLALVGIAPLSSRLTRSLDALTAAVQQFARGNFGVRVAVRSGNEVGLLARAFNDMARDVQAHQQLLVQQERLGRELELCRQIQTEMLPKEALRLELAEVKGVSIPAREVGGDFFNYFLLRDGQIALLVGDVSGKGVGAALLMANIQATLQARLPLEPDLAKLADAIDREVDRNTPRGVFITLFAGVLDTAGKTLRYVNAGHNPQFVLRASGGLERLSSAGLPLGLFSGHGYAERTLALADGDLLFLYTDGMVEVENETGDMFGTERLEALLIAEHEKRVDDVLERVEQTVRTFRGNAEPFDDATMMALRFGALARAAAA